MLPQTVLLALVAAVGAVPLNINLGAYSPALVVGDGEISLGNTESASALMSTLASGANEANRGGARQGEQRPNNEQPPAQGQPAGQNQGERPAEGQAGKRRNVRRTLESLFSRSPEPVQDDKFAAYEEAMHWIKRDINGFNAALSYAREAMKNMPKVELGSEGAGIGIVVSPGLSVPANSAANGERPAGERPAGERPAGERPPGGKKTKRSEVVAEDESPKMTLVAITEV